MVQEITKGDKKYYKCKECDLSYSDKETAEKCEAWCRENKSCNLDIIKYAIKDFTETN